MVNVIHTLANPRCPNNVPPSHDFNCSFCGNGVYNKDPCAIKDWDFMCTDCIENLSDEQLAYFLSRRNVWKITLRGAKKHRTVAERCFFVEDGSELQRISP